MSDLIKKIKIKKQDGTFTDYIPIGAEAQNVSTSDGESVQLKLNKKPYYYDTVADMKADIKLKAGDMAVTLGYYEINDGGGAKYYIIDTPDETKYQETVNSLYAELIIKDNVNVKQFGAYGNKINDDSNAFNNAIKYFKNKTLYIPDGDYLISQTINVPFDVSLEGLGSIPNLYYSGNNIFISINGHEKKADESGTVVSNDKNEKKPILKNLHLETIYQSNELGVSGTTGILLNTNNNTQISRSFIENVEIFRFENGLSFNPYNIYIMTFNNLTFRKNNNAIITGTSSSNSGEKMTFNNCLFDSNKIVLSLNNTSALHWYFRNCSLDFNTCFIYSPEKSNCDLRLSNSHYETFDNSGVEIHGLIYGAISSLIIKDNVFYTRSNESLINNINNNVMFVSFISNKFDFPGEEYNNYNIENQYIVLPKSNNNIFALNNIQTLQGIPINYFNSKLRYNSGIGTVGNLSVSDKKLMDSSNKYIGWDIDELTNISSQYLTEINPITNFQEIKLINTENDLKSSATLTSQFIEINPNMHNLNLWLSLKNVTHYTINQYFYDENQEYITHSRIFDQDLDYNSIIADKLTILPRVLATRFSNVNIANKCKYVKFKITISNEYMENNNMSLCLFYVD